MKTLLTILLLALAVTVQGAGGVTPPVIFPKSNTVYVSGATLREFTGAAAPINAKNSALGGQWIIFGPGTYTVTNLLKRGVNYDARQAKLRVRDATVACHAIWDDRTTGATTNTILAGSIEWEDIEDDGSTRAGIAVTASDPLTDIVFHCERGYVNDGNISIGGDVGFVNVTGGAKVYYRVNDLSAGQDSHCQALYVNDGTVTFEFGKVNMGHGRGISIEAVGDPINTILRGGSIRVQTGGPPLYFAGDGLTTNTVEIGEVNGSDGVPLQISGGNNTVKVQTLSVNAGTPFQFSGGNNIVSIQNAHTLAGQIGFITGGFNELRGQLFKSFVSGVAASPWLTISGGTNLIEDIHLVGTNAIGIRLSGQHQTRLKDCLIETFNTNASGDTNWPVQNLTNGLTFQNTVLKAPNANVKALWTTNVNNHNNIEGLLYVTTTTNSTSTITNGVYKQQGNPSRL